MKKKKHSIKAAATAWSIVFLIVFALLWFNPFATAQFKKSPGVEVEMDLPDTEPWQENMARGQLQDLYLNCKMFWKNEGDEKTCSIEIVSSSPYYFSQTPIDRTKEEGFAPVILRSGFKTDFSAHASHEGSPVIWTIDDKGDFNCSLGERRACVAITHLTREEILAEVREFWGDVPDNVEYLEIK